MKKKYFVEVFFNGSEIHNSICENIENLDKELKSSLNYGFKTIALFIIYPKDI